MEFGVFHEFPALVGRPDSDAFEEAFDIVDGAERWGLDVMWLAELHSTNRARYCHRRCASPARSPRERNG